MGLWDFAKGYRPLVEGSHSSTPWSTPSVALQTAREAYSHTIPRFRMRWVAALIVSTAAIVLSLTYLRANTEVAASASSIPSASSVPSAVLVDGTTFQKPEGFKIIGLLFFGRRATMSILECYLRNNLVAYGGFLDEIHFITNTGDEDDLAWLAQMVDEVDDYIRVDLEQAGYVRDFNRIYAESLKRDNMYVKLDDDLVWISPNAIPELVNTKLKHPESFAVLASLINSATMGWVQYRLGAVHSYFPERKPPVVKLGLGLQASGDESYGPKAWRASALPTWEPPSEGEIEEFPQADKKGKGDHAPVGSPGAAPYMNHRWLPLRDEDRYIAKTPIARAEYEPGGRSWSEWPIGAQQHYSLLENIEKDQLHKYYIGEDGIWNMRYLRTNINLIAIWANDILDNLPFEGADDEQLISSTLPFEQHRQNLVQTHALTAHFSFGVQPEMYDTDLLSRYRAFANDKICTSKNQIPIQDS